MWDYVAARLPQILFAGWQHVSLVAQCLVLATVLSVLIAVLVYRSGRWTAAANAVSAIGLTIPSFAVVGLLIAPVGYGVAPAVIIVTFFATLPILRNAVVGLASVPTATVESARGMGMGRVRTLLAVELPMAWPVILAGVDVEGEEPTDVASDWMLAKGLVSEPAA